MSSNENQEDRRVSDAVIIQLKTQFEGFVEHYGQNQAEAKEWRSKIETDIASMRDKVDKIFLPYKILTWACYISGGFIIIEFIKRFIHIFLRGTN